MSIAEGMPVTVLNFADLRKTLNEKNDEPLNTLVEKVDTAYVVAVTREKCPGCEEQEPLFEKLESRMKKKYARQIEFFRVHAFFSQEQREEAKQCLTAFRTVAFPTYVIGIKDDVGTCRETYRSIEPPMKEIERNVDIAVELATRFESPKQ